MAKVGQTGGAVPMGVTTPELHPVVWIDLVGCGSARRPTIKVPAIRADLVAGSAYFAAMLDGPYRESRQAGAEAIAVDIPPLRDAVLVTTVQRGRRRRNGAPCPAERLCSAFVRTLTRDGRPPKACDVLLLWRALCFVGASTAVMETCAHVVHDAMGLSDLGGGGGLADDALPHDAFVCHRGIKRARVGSHAQDRDGDAGAPSDYRDLAATPETAEAETDEDGGHCSHVVARRKTARRSAEDDDGRVERDRPVAPCTVAGPAAVAMPSAMPHITVVAHLYALLGGAIPTVGDDGGDGTVRDLVADALLPDPWAHFGLDWSRASRTRAAAYMRFGQQVIRDSRVTLCDALWCASADQSARALIAMMRDWASALWPAERLGLLTTGVDAFDHRLAKAVLPDAAPPHFAAAVIKRFPVFGPVFLDATAESAPGVFGRLPQGVVLAGGCALYALCRSSLTARRHQCDGDEFVAAYPLDDGVGDAARQTWRAARRAVATCGSVLPGDIDLFIVGPSNSARRTAMALALNAVMDAVSDCRAAVGSSVITLWTPRSPNERLQLVFTDKTRAEAVPVGFDMTHLGVACSRDTGVVISWGALHALATGTTCTTPGRVVEPERASKAQARGFALVDSVQRQQQQHNEKYAESSVRVTAASVAQDRALDYVAYSDAEAVLANFAYGQVVNDNYCADQPRTGDRRQSERTAEPLGDARLNLVRVAFAARRRHVAVDRAPAAIVLCPTICSMSAAVSWRSGRPLRLTINPPRAYGDVTSSTMAVVDLRRAEVDLVRRAVEARVGPQHLAARHCWRGRERGLTLTDGCAAVLAGIAPPWWTSPLAPSGASVRRGDTSAYALYVHVTAETHLTDGVTGRRLTLEEAREVGDASVAATVVMGSVVCEEDNGGPFFAIATLVAAAFYPLGVPAILDALKSARS